MAVDLTKLARLFEQHDVMVVLAGGDGWFTVEEKAAIAQAMKDAARYRHLRDHWDDFTDYASKNPGEWLDKTIDAVLNAGSVGDRSSTRGLDK